MVTTRKKPTAKELNKCLKVIRENKTNMALELSSFTREALFTICTDYNIRAAEHNLVVGIKWVLAQNIYHWVSIFAPLLYWKLTCVIHFSSKEVIPVYTHSLHSLNLGIRVHTLPTQNPQARARHLRNFNFLLFQKVFPWELSNVSYDISRQTTNQKKTAEKLIARVLRQYSDTFAISWVSTSAHSVPSQRSRSYLMLSRIW
jgi:hypothetical protein